MKKTNGVTVSKRVAQAIKDVAIHNTASEIVEAHFEGTWTGIYAPLGDLTLDEIIRAVYVGYEVEKTPEEEVKELYDSYGPNSHGEQIYQDERVQTGIRMTLNILGMTVEGINDGN